MIDAALVIRDKDLAIVRAILTEHLPASAKVWVFGSRARGTTKRAADLDLAIEAGRPLSRDETGALADAFEDSDLPYTVDVVDMASVSDAFGDIVRRDRIPFPS